MNSESPQWTIEKLLALGGGFMESRIYLTAVELGLFPFINQEGVTSQQVVDHFKTDPRATRILLDALSAIKLLIKEGDLYRLEPSTTQFLSDTTKETVLPMAAHSAVMFKKWSGLTEVLQTGKPTILKLDESQTQANMHSFINAMHVLGRKMSREIAQVVDTSSSHRLLDVGGASGSYTIAFLEANPNMTATLFDRKGVIPLAEELLGKLGLLPRVTLCEGDFYQDELPGGHDLALLSAIIHQNSREQNVALYRKVYGALVSGGRILIRDYVLAPSRTEPRLGATFAINMLVSTEGGDCYTLEEISEDLVCAGFGSVRFIKQGSKMDGLVDARRE